MDLDEAKGEVFLNLVEANSLLLAAIDRQLRELCQLSHAQFEILVRLAAAPDGMRMGDLAAALVFSASGLTYQASQLEKRGLMARSKSADGDERTVVASITPEGIEQLERVRPQHLQLVQEALFDQMSEKETLLVADVLKRVVAALRRK